MGESVNKQQLAKILGRSVKILTEWQREGMPVEVLGKGGRGRSSEYDTAKVIDWLIQRERKNLVTTGDGEVYDFATEKSRLTYHQANKAELEEKVLRGELQHVDEIRAKWSAELTAFRAKLLAIPTKSAPEMQYLNDLSEIEEFLKSMIHDALGELTEYGDD